MMKSLKKGIVLALLSSCAISLSAQQATIHLKNQLAVERKNELIQINRSLIEKKLGKKAGPNVLKITLTNGTYVPTQFDDLDMDGEWDVATMVVSFMPNESVDINWKIVPPDTFVTFRRAAHVRQRRKMADDSFGPALDVDSVPAGQPNTDFSKSALPPFLTEGPAWENDKVGFRIYMDVRNTKDIWGKTTREMMMDTVGVNPKVIYHHLAAWGMDILAVGKSLGAGSLALRVPIAGKADTLVRLGGVNMGKIKYKMIADGPIRAVFQLEYPEWNVLGNGKLTSITEEISIGYGQYFYESKVSIKNAPQGAHLITGIVNLKSSKSMKDNDEQVMMLSTFDKQSENADNLGMAILVNKSSFITFGQTPDKNSEVLNTYTADMKVPIGSKRVAFRFYSCWQRTNPAFETEKGFKLFLFKEASTMNSPIEIK